MADFNDRAVAARALTKADFQSWRHHPVSKVFLAFLKDKRDFMASAAVDRWVAGSLSLQEDQTIRGQIIELADLETMQFEDLDSFYRMELDNDAAEAT